MNLDAASRGFHIAATLWAAVAAPAGGFAQTLFYSEVERDGRLEWYLHASVRISPNVEWVDYDDPAMGKDVVPRVTFYWTR